LAPYVPTPQDVVERMLALANVQKTDFVIDLGCGDGRIPVTAAKKYGARALGVDIDPVRIEEANANAKAAGVEHLVTFKLENALTTDVSTATVVTTYLLSASNLRLRPILTKQLKPGSRIVAHSFSFGDWTPEKTDTFVDAAGRSRVLYLYIADGKVRQ
jgi:ribosomal protein L11 methylase PrmA